MKHYSRENERSRARIEELEQRKTTCEAGLAAISACWAQVQACLFGLKRSNSQVYNTVF